MTVLLLALSAAHAFEEVCAAPYDNASFRVDLQGVDQAFADLDVPEARQRISGVHRKLLCLQERVDPIGMGRFSRQLSLAFFFDQDEAAMTRWARAAQTLAPDLPWYADLGEDHPFRELYADVAIPESASPDAALVVPKNGAIFWNGLARTTPAAPIETPGLVQVADKKDSWAAVWWQDGSAYPEEYLGPADTVVELPKWLDEVVSDPGFAEDARRTLFGEAELAVIEPVPVVEVDPDAAQAPGAYIDPFQDARLRAIRRETFESTGTNDAGDKVTLRTEIVTLARDDKSGGKPVTYAVYQYWMEDMPSWTPDQTRNSGAAGSDYLSDWVAGKPPMGASRTPLVNVPFAAAEAYCASFRALLPDVDARFDDALPWEWRFDGVASVRVSAKGKVKKVDDRKEARADTGFRCAPPQGR